LPVLAAAQNAPSVGDDARPKPKLTKAPKLVQFVEAAYPESEKAAGRAASVVLQIAIAASGTVDQVAVIESAGAAFDSAALDAAQRFVFEPAEIDGKPAPIKINYRYEFVLKEEAPTTGSFVGTVRVRGTGEPLAGVTVELEDGQSAVTDASGRFEFPELAPGPRRITLRKDDLKPLQTEETLEAGKRLETLYELDLQAPPEPGASEEEQDDMEIVIAAPKLTRQVVSTQVQADQAKRVAGTQGDVLKIVENMPGVARATAGSGQVVVWGASPQDTRVYVDEVRVPLLYHFGGLRSVVHSDLVRSVELVPGGYGASYGRGLGGLVTVDTRDPDAKKFHGSAQLDVLDASAAANGPLSERLRVSGSFRRSHLDWVLDQVTDEDVNEFFPIPKYYDGQARVRYQLGQTSWIEAGGLASSDRVSRNVTSADPADRKSETRTMYFDRAFLRYRSTVSDGSEVRATTWFGRDESTLVSRFGATETALALDSMTYGLRTSWHGRMTSFITATAGLDFEGASSTATRAGSVTSPAREGDPRVFGQAPSDQVNVDEWEVQSGSVAPYVEADIAAFSDKLHIVPGVRVEPVLTSVNRRNPVEGDNPDIGVFTSEVSVQPRVSLRYAVSPRVTVKAAHGRYKQPPMAEDLSSVFGNPTLGSASAVHWLAGAAVNITKLLALETTVFYSKSDELPVRNPISAPLIAEALVGNGEGRAYGAQFLLRRELADRFFGWVAYTLLRSERLDEPGGRWRLFDYDQTHVFTALASYDLGKGFDVGARVRYSTGYPRTPVVGTYYDARRDSFEPLLGETNSIRIPDFVQLDVRVAKRFKIATSELELYADIQNVTHRSNPEEIVYSADYRQRRYIEGLPILPVVGAAWRF
jgi:TonB family protein